MTIRSRVTGGEGTEEGLVTQQEIIFAFWPSSSSSPDGQKVAVGKQGTRQEGVVFWLGWQVRGPASQLRSAEVNVNQGGTQC